MGQRNADMKEVQAGSGGGAKPVAIAMEVMSAHRAEYERLSELHKLDPLPTPNRDSSGQLHFELTMDGHSVIFLRLE